MDRKATAAAGLLWALVVLVPPAWSQVAPDLEVQITEIQAINETTLADEDGEFRDWVELYNPGLAPVNLAGWALTDDADEPAKWTFPEVELQPRGFLVVFCSDKNRTDPDGELHTNFKLGGTEGEFLALVKPDSRPASIYVPRFPEQVADASFGIAHDAPVTILLPEGAPGTAYVPSDGSLGLDWVEADFNDAAWYRGHAGFGFDQRSRPTLDAEIETDLGAAMRRINASVYLRFAFEVTDPASLDLLRLRMKYEDGFVAYINGVEIARRNAPDELTWDADADGRQASPENTLFEDFDVTTAHTLLVPGRNVLAIHGLNDSQSSSDFLIEPELSGVSLGELSAARQYFERPSPGWPNGVGVDTISPEPEFSHTTGAYTDEVVLELHSPEPGAEIRYTLDGSRPDVDSLLYEGPLAIVETSEVRARVYVPGRIGGRAVGHSYVIVDPELLDFSSNVPIVVVSTFGRVVGGVWTPAHLYVIDVDEETGRADFRSEPHYSGRMAIKTRGSSTGGRQKASYNFELQDDEAEDLDAELLGMPADSDWILYGPYNFDRALIRNSFVYELSNLVGQYAVRTRPVEVYMNRQSKLGDSSYFGAYVLMEKIKRGDERVAVERLGPGDITEPEISGGYMWKIDRADPGDTGFSAGSQSLLWVYPKEIDMRSRPEQRQWVVQYLNDMVAALTRRNLEEYSQYVDVDAWIDHHIINEFTKNPDQFVLSTYLFKPRSGPVAFGPVWDFDRALGSDDDARSQDPRNWGNNRTAHWYGRIFGDPEFQLRYEARWRELRAGAMSVESMHEIIDRQAAEFAEAQERNFRRWPLPLGGTIRSGPGWQGEIDHLKNWVSDRVAWIDSQYVRPPQFSHEGGRVETPFELTITTNGAGEIFFTVDGSDARDEASGDVGPTAALVTGPVVITENTRVRARVRLGGSVWGGLTEATFTVTSPPVVISEILFRPLGTQDLEFIELFNYGDAPVDLASCSFGGINFDFDEDALATILPAGGYGVVVKDLEVFAQRYSRGDILVLGEFRSGSLSDRGEDVVLIGPVGETFFSVDYDRDWAPQTAEGGYSLVLIDPRTPPDRWTLAESWRGSHEEGGSPGHEDVPPPEGYQVPGDVDQNGRVNLSDVLQTLDFLFFGRGQLPCATGLPTEGANLLLLSANGDIRVDASDAMHLLTYLYLAGPPHALGVECRTIPGCPDVCGGPEE